MPRIARRLSIIVIWAFLGTCAVFMFFPELVPIAMDPDPARGLTTLLHVNGTRGTPSYDCYTWPWAAETYKALRIGVMAAAAPFVAALIVVHRTRTPRA